LRAALRGRAPCASHSWSASRSPLSAQDGLLPELTALLNHCIPTLLSTRTAARSRTIQPRSELGEALIRSVLRQLDHGIVAGLDIDIALAVELGFGRELLDDRLLDLKIGRVIEMEVVAKDGTSLVLKGDASADGLTNGVGALLLLLLVRGLLHLQLLLELITLGLDPLQLLFELLLLLLGFVEQLLERIKFGPHRLRALIGRLVVDSDDSNQCHWLL